MLFFFFFKQKTAYEMRISDWSSDVCSSDLIGHNRPGLQHDNAALALRGNASKLDARDEFHLLFRRRKRRLSEVEGLGFTSFRSEEHTSELQSLMRISYAVFCLKTKKQISKRKYHFFTSSRHCNSIKN